MRGAKNRYKNNTDTKQSASYNIIRAISKTSIAINIVYDINSFIPNPP